MMKIKFHGKTCLSIQGGDLNWLTDPYAGLNKSLKANVVTLSQSDINEEGLKKVEGDYKIFDWPGEYENKGVHFKGISSFHNPRESEEQKENTIFTIASGGINICHLGELGTKLTTEQLEEMGEVDVLMIPIGGKNTIDAKKAKEVIEQVEPRVIIPMCYGGEEGESETENVRPFLTQMGIQNLEAIDELSLKPSDLPEDSSRVVVLNKQ